MRCREPSSRPLVALTIKACGGISGRMRSNRARQCCEGMTLTTMRRVAESCCQIVAGGDGSGMRRPGRNLLVDALLRDRFADVGFMRPQAYAVRAFAAEHDGDAGAPRASADDCDLAHACFDPKRFSVPASRRRMLAWCRRMMSTDASAINTSARGRLPYSCRTSAILGKAATATIEPRDT